LPAPTATRRILVFLQHEPSKLNSPLYLSKIRWTELGTQTL
jgi:hypothetical protein